MKLLTKLTLFITGSKLLIVVLFVSLLPWLVAGVSLRYTNYSLEQQKKKVKSVIAKNGIDYYLQGDSSYGSYTMLKEEYIALLPAGGAPVRDTIETSRRMIEDDTLDYRVLVSGIRAGNKYYQLEIGKTISTIGAYNQLLQQFTLYALISLIALSIIVDLVYAHVLLRPLSKIVRTKILDRKFPFKETLDPVQTSTTDFKFLDASLISLMEKIHDAFSKEREFTSNASHELMTPISILQTNMENMMIEDGLSEDQQEKILAAMKTLQRLRKIVHSLLCISRIENEQFMKKDSICVELLVKEITEELAHRIEVKAIHFSTDIRPGQQLVNVNRDLIFQLLYNLINNAIRYNQQGGTIHVHAKGNLITISDTGIGIRQEDLPTILDRFKKSGNAGSDGYGLGLSIVKSIADYHGASLKLQSQLGKGTLVSLVFQDQIPIKKRTA